MEIGMRIKLRREELGMSQEELAKKVGYKSRSSVNKIEIDGRGLPQNKIIMFAKALQTTPAYLMGWEDENEMTSSQQGCMELRESAINGLYSAFGENEISHFKQYIQLNPSYMRKVDNYTQNLLSMQKMEHEVELAAAHERTDVKVTEKARLEDDDIMKNDSEWK